MHLENNNANFCFMPTIRQLKGGTFILLSSIFTIHISRVIHLPV